MGFTFVDVLLVLVVLLSALHGWHRGFLLGLFDLVRWIASFLAGLRFYPYLANWLGPATEWSEVWLRPLSFILIVIIVSAAIQALGYSLLRRLPRNIHQRQVNRLFGIVPGFVNGLILVAILSALLISTPLPEAIATASRESKLANELAKTTEQLEEALAPIFNEAIGRTLNKLTVQPGSNEVVKLPYTVDSPRPRPDLEAEMLNLVNQERAEAGLSSLAPDEELKEVARSHSVDMFGRGYFSHYTPENQSPFDRINEAGISYRIAGENLALAPTLPLAHTGLMNSPGHRANILRPQFGRVGIGVLDGGRRGLMVTQNFRN